MNAKLPAMSEPAYVGDARRWRAVCERDPGADGHFVYSVATTGVFCRPACPSRPALRRNVQFHDTCADAELAGFRPCRRCRPEAAAERASHALAVERACRLIDQSETPPPLAALATAAGLSPHHFHRVFRQATGVTPRQYAVGRRQERLRAGLRQPGTVTDALYAAGFGSSSRVYEGGPTMLGMTAGEYRQQGEGLDIHFAVAPCALGLVLVAATARGVCAVRLGDDRAGLTAELHREFPRAEIAAAGSQTGRWLRAVVRHIDQPGAVPDLPLDIRGTAFQQRVWLALRNIPSGTTMTYAQLAAAIGQPAAARAVGAACGANGIGILIPCHRVVRTDGSLSGYRWGLARKQALIDRERAGSGLAATHARPSQHPAREA